jgi:hypothetical protein
MTASSEGRSGNPAAGRPGVDAGREARRLAAAILEVLAGLRTPAQAAEAVSVSLPRYYQLEARGLAGLVAALVPKPRGRQRTPAGTLAALTMENERLQRDLGRQQALVRLAQRSAGLSPPPPPAKGKQKRPPARRALVAAKRLRAEPDAAPAAPEE